MQAVSDLTWHVPVRERPTIMYAATGAFEASTWTFCLDKHWTLHIFFYHAYLHTSGYTFTINPGTMLLIPPGVANTYDFLEHSVHHCAHFKYEGRDGYEGADRSTAPLPAFCELEERFARLEEGMAEMVASFSENPLRAEVRLWDILLDLADAAPETPACGSHPAVRRIRRLIEQRLGETISIPALVEEGGYSHNHVNRLFRAELGLTVGAYLAQRRMRRASYLLRYTSDPVKTVAAQVGFHDLHHFNKAVRRAFGCSPRDLRGTRRPEI